MRSQWRGSFLPRFVMAGSGAFVDKLLGVQ